MGEIGCAALLAPNAMDSEEDGGGKGVVGCRARIPFLRSLTIRRATAQLPLSLSLSPHFIASQRGGVEFSKEEGGRDERGREGRTVIDGPVKSERRA